MDQYRPARLDDGPPTSPDGWWDDGRGSAKSPPRKLPVVNAASLAGREIPLRLWHVAGMIPTGTVTLLGGDGGTGKSLLALQLAVATASGRQWIGRDVRRGAVLFLTAEDDLDEIHRRLDAILAESGTVFEEVPDLSLVSLASEDAVLGRFDTGSNTVKATPLFDAVKQHVRDIKPVLVVLDTLSDLFAGDENQRTQARQFVGLLRSLAVGERIAIVLLAHPSLSGMSTGSGMSGSTAWSNSVRSRLYLDRLKSESGVDDDPDARVLKVMKANYAPVGAEIKLRWRAGVFSQDGKAGSGFATIAAHARADEIFLSLLDAYSANKRSVGANPSGIYAPTVFAKDARAGGLNKQTLRAAMDRCFAAKLIEVVEEGPPTKRRQRLRRC